MKLSWNYLQRMLIKLTEYELWNIQQHAKQVCDVIHEKYRNNFRREVVLSHQDNAWLLVDTTCWTLRKPEWNLIQQSRQGHLQIFIYFLINSCILMIESLIQMRRSLMRMISFWTRAYCSVSQKDWKVGRRLHIYYMEITILISFTVFVCIYKLTIIFVFGNFFYCYYSTWYENKSYKSKQRNFRRKELVCMW